MQFFLPGLALFLFAIAITFFLAPYATPMVASILYIIFLSYGVYDHYHLFASEYRLSTWQDAWKIYAPFIMIGAIILYVIYGIMAFFSGGKVPVPSMPSVSNVTTNLSKSVSDMANTATSYMNDTANAAANAVNNAANAGNNMLKNITSNTGNNTGNTSSSNANRNNTSQNNTSRYFDKDNL
jgi:predicted PurR-regulated permease PerM